MTKEHVFCGPLLYFSTTCSQIKTQILGEGRVCLLSLQSTPMESMICFCFHITLPEHLRKQVGKLPYTRNAPWSGRVRLGLCYGKEGATGNKGRSVSLNWSVSTSPLVSQLGISMGGKVRVEEENFSKVSPKNLLKITSSAPQCIS